MRSGERYWAEGLLVFVVILAVIVAIVVGLFLAFIPQ
jgi:hypothetical protein